MPKESGTGSVLDERRRSVEGWPDGQRGMTGKDDET